MHFEQIEIVLTAKTRGFHLVTDEILDQLPNLSTLNAGMLHLLLQHTSASLSLMKMLTPRYVRI